MSQITSIGNTLPPPSSSVPDVLWSQSDVKWQSFDPGVVEALLSSDTTNEGAKFFYRYAVEFLKNPSEIMDRTAEEIQVWKNKFLEDVSSITVPDDEYCLSELLQQNSVWMSEENKKRCSSFMSFRTSLFCQDANELRKWVEDERMTCISLCQKAEEISSRMREVCFEIIKKLREPRFLEILKKDGATEEVRLEAVLLEYMAKVVVSNRGQTMKLTEKISIKLRLIGSDIQARLFYLLGAGSSRETYRVLYLTKPFHSNPLLAVEEYGYERPIELRKRVKYYDALQQRAVVSFSSGGEEEQEAREAYQREKARLFLDCTLASRLVDGIKTIPVYKTLDAGRLKGFVFAKEDIGETLVAAVASIPVRDPKRAEYVQWLAQQASEAVCRLHCQGVLHLDLKASNFIVISQGTSPKVRVIDFASSSSLYKPGLWTSRIATFSPPETFMNLWINKPCCLAMDYWGLGVTIFEMTYGYAEFEKIIDVSGEWKTSYEKLPFILSGLPLSIPKINTVLLGLMHPNPEKRMKAVEAAGLLKK